MSENPLSVLNNLDPSLYESIQANGKALLHSPGALEYKHKLLIAMALDASKGAVNGVAVLAGMAMDNGATKEEIADTLKVVYHICGMGSMYISALGLKDIID